jgi:hypothetical protein
VRRTASVSVPPLSDLVSAVHRARRVAELVVLRLSLPARLAREPLDGLLASLTPTHVELAQGAPALSVLARDVLRAERGIARLPWVSSTCLYRSLARYAMLRRAGNEATFVMGLGRDRVNEDGHAWVELGGQPFEEPDDVARYTVTFRYPPLAKDATTGTP